VIAKGRARTHHVLPDSGWVSVPLRSMEDVAPALEILRQSYDLAIAQMEKRGASSPDPSTKARTRS